MNSFITYIRNTFTKKNNFIFFVLSFLVALTLTISLSTSKIKTEKEYCYYSQFPSDFSFLFYQNKNYKSILNEDFPEMNYTSLRVYSGNVDLNIELFGKKIVLVGVDPSFIDYPLPSFSQIKTNTNLEKTSIISGETISDNDVFGYSKVVLMNNYYLNALDLDSNCIYINGVEFSIKGVLSDTNSVYRYADSNDTCIPIYMPYTTLEKLVATDDFEYQCVIQTNGYRFPKYEEEEHKTLVTKYLVDKKKMDYEFELTIQSLPLLISLFVLSFVATFIVQYIVVRNRHYEIGIKRAIGARKQDIVFEFLSSYSLVTIFAVILGFFCGLVTMVLFNLQECISLNSFVICFNFPLLIISLMAFFFFLFICSFLSILAGARMNIASIIVEER